MNAVNESIKSEVANMLTEQFQLQKKCSLDNPTPDYQQRVSDLKALKAMIIDNREEIIQAISADYFNRSRNETLFAEIITVTDGINSIIKSLKKWMKPQKRHVDQTMFFGAKNRVIPQPLGVVGLIIPWNFPINLSFSQLATAFASGNRAMVKMSENSIALTELLISISGNYFPPEKLQFFKETGSVGVEFSQIPFDLIVFTGSGQTGRAVMASAAKKLNPGYFRTGR
jgi:coniferyl-aldehyde dehydrogenase